MRYNSAHKIFFAEPVLTVRFVQHAKRYKKTTYFRRRLQPDTFWWNPINSYILQKSKVKVAFTDLCKISSTLQSLPSYRFNLNHHLRNNRRYLSLKQNQNFTKQQFFSANNWSKEFSLCQQLKTLPETNRFQDNSEHQQGTRPVETKDVPAQVSHKPLIRFGFFRSYHLWKIHRRGQSGLQSAQKRQKVISSPALFRVTHQRLLAWSLKTRRCLYRIWFSRVLERMSCQDATLCLPYTLTSRFRLLRPQIHRAPRRRKNWLCNCSQDHSSHQETLRKPALSPIQKGLGSGRVQLPTVEMEKASSLCSNTQAIVSEKLRADDTFHTDPLCLSGVCNQPSHGSTKHLVLLQRPSRNRANYQRAKGRLYFSQNSNKQLPSQSILFLFTPFCLQYSQLVQEKLFTSKVSECYLADHSHRIFSSACKINQIGKQECAQDTSTIYFPTDIGTDYAQN